MYEADDGELQVFMAAIRAVESGGEADPYRAQGFSTHAEYGRAQGAYQIMSKIMPEFARRTPGYEDISLEEFLANPAAQDAIAGTEMRRLYGEYGDWRLVAAAWFGGPGAANEARDHGWDAVADRNDGANSVPDYVDKVMAAAEDQDGALPTEPSEPTPDQGPSGEDTEVTREFLHLMLAQTGDSYVFGAEADGSDVDPEAFDCSELVQWAGARLDIDIPDGTWNQYLWLKEQGMVVPVEDAIDTPGALLFNFSSEPTRGGGRPSSAHVAVSLGNGETIEARGTKWGVGSWEATEERFGYAAIIPQLADGSASLPAADDLDAQLALLSTDLHRHADQVDTDEDGILDEAELAAGTDPTKKDSDGDLISDLAEQLEMGTDPTRADSDGDGMDDGYEIARRADPLNPDSDGDGRLDWSTAPAVDTDKDGIEDLLERVLGTDPNRLDSDGDGFTDGSEHFAGHDPLDVMIGRPTSLVEDDALVDAGIWEVDDVDDDLVDG